MHSFITHGPDGPVGGAFIGDGPPLVLLAGVGADRRVWGDLPRLLARAGLRAIVLDNRGVGASRASSPFTLRGVAHDVVGVLDHLGLSSASLFGASMGGAIALATAAEAPERVDRLVVASCAAHLSIHGRATLSLLAELLERLEPALFGRTLMTLAFAPPFVELFPDLVTEVAASYGPDPADVPGTRAQLAHLLEGWDLRTGLSRVGAPALVIAGGRDPVVAVEDTREVARALPAAELVVLPHAAHSVLAEGGPELLQRVVRFLTYC